MKHEPIQKVEPTFNVMNMMALREHLTALRERPTYNNIGFNMSSYVGYNQFCNSQSNLRDWSGHNCCTVACIAGHATLLSGISLAPEDLFVGADFNPFEIARKWLGLSYREANYLFMGEFMWDIHDTGGLREITLSDALAELDRILQAGKILRPNRFREKWADTNGSIREVPLICSR